MEQTVVKKGSINHNKDWRKREKLYYSRRIAQVVLIITWCICFIMCLSHYAEQEESKSVAEYKEDIPFAQLADFSVPGKCMAKTETQSGEITKKQDLLAPTIIEWNEELEFTLGDGSTENHRLSLDYYETRSHLLAMELVREYEKRNARHSVRTKINADSLNLDYAVTYNLGNSTTMILRKGNIVLCATIYQNDSDNKLSANELIAVAAKGMEE